MEWVPFFEIGVKQASEEVQMAVRFQCPSVSNAKTLASFNCGTAHAKNNIMIQNDTNFSSPPVTPAYWNRSPVHFDSFQGKLGSNDQYHIIIICYVGGCSDDQAMESPGWDGQNPFTRGSVVERGNGRNLLVFKVLIKTSCQALQPLNPWKEIRMQCILWMWCITWISAMTFNGIAKVHVLLVTVITSHAETN